MNINTILNTFIISLFLSVQPLQADDSDLIESLIEYMEFTEYQGANILPEQIPVDDWKNFHIIDTRRVEDYEVEHIENAVHIEWRQLVNKRDEIPMETPVIVYCNTGSLSAQGAFALKVIGYENVKILTGGYNGFKSKGGRDAYARATNPKF